MMHRSRYSDARSGRSCDCDIALQNGVLNLYLHDEEKRLLVWSLRSLKCQYSGATLIASHRDFEKLECSGEIARTIYAEWTGPLQQQRKRPGAGKTFAVLGLVAALLLSFLLAVYFWVLPWAGEQAANLIPRDVEVELGQGLSRQLGGDKRADRADSLLNAFARRLDFDSEYPLKLHVLHSDEINAFAVPGGNIFVYSGIISKMNSYEQLVALLGHEASHVEKRHSLKSVCRSAASGFFIAAILGDVAGISAGILTQADEFRQLQYSRELETEADIEGLKFMRRNRVNQNGMLDLLRLLEKESVKMPRLMKYVRTHPETLERMENVEAGITESAQEVNEAMNAIFLELKGELVTKPRR